MTDGCPNVYYVKSQLVFHSFQEAIVENQGLWGEITLVSDLHPLVNRSIYPQFVRQTWGTHEKGGRHNFGGNEVHCSFDAFKSTTPVFISLRYYTTTALL